MKYLLIAFVLSGCSSSSTNASTSSHVDAGFDAAAPRLDSGKDRSDAASSDANPGPQSPSISVPPITGPSRPELADSGMPVSDASGPSRLDAAPEPTPAPIPEPIAEPDAPPLPWGCQDECGAAAVAWCQSDPERLQACETVVRCGQPSCTEFSYSHPVYGHVQGWNCGCTDQEIYFGNGAARAARGEENGYRIELFEEWRSELEQLWACCGQ